MTSSSQSANSQAEANPHPVIELASGEYQASIASYGGGIKALTFAGYPLVETYPDGVYPPMSCGVVLAPWTNRTEDGEFNFQGTTYQLEINEPARGNAIHGFARTGWTVVSATSDKATLELVITDKPGWPWTITLQAHYELDLDGLHASYTATADQECPYAFGLHTYLSAWGAPANDCVLTIPLELNYPLNDRNLPEDDPIPATEVIPNITTGAPVKDMLLDHCFRTGPATESQRSTLINQQGTGVELETSPGLEWIQIFTPDPEHGKGYPGRGRAIAVEPMSAPPNALRSGESLGLLSAGHPITHSISLRAIGH